MLVAGAVIVAACIRLMVRLDRVPPLEQPDHSPHMAILYGPERVVEPCAADGRDVIVHLLKSGSNPSPVQVNGTDVEWKALPLLLEDIYKTRAKRAVFLMNDSEVDSPQWLDLVQMVRRSRVIDAACVIDHSHPPGWYPPLRLPAGSGEPSAIDHSHPPAWYPPPVSYSVN